MMVQLTTIIMMNLSLDIFKKRNLSLDISKIRKSRILQVRKYFFGPIKFESMYATTRELDLND